MIIGLSLAVTSQVGGQEFHIVEWRERKLDVHKSCRYSTQKDEFEQSSADFWKFFYYSEIANELLDRSEI